MWRGTSSGFLHPGWERKSTWEKRLEEQWVALKGAEERLHNFVRSKVSTATQYQSTYQDLVDDVTVGSH